jgi:predicted nucleic acid-binding protein
MKAVLDSRVALKWVLAEADSAKALDVRTKFQKQLHELLSPDIFFAECAHALARAERKAIIKQGEAAVLLGDILSTPPDLHGYLALMPRAVEIASDMRCGFYDCLYIALAEREGCELLTSDQKMVAHLPAQFPFIVPLSSLP